MKKKIQVLLFFLVFVIVCGFFSANLARAADDYDLSIETINYTASSNLLQRSLPALTGFDYENVQVEKCCYTGETFSLTAVIVPANAYVGEVVWKIEPDADNREIAKIISTSGLSVTIKGVNAGTCNVVCVAADGQGAYTTCKLTVLQHATEIKLHPTNLILEPNETQQIMATVLPESTTDKTVVWKSSNENIATIDQDGVVTAVSASLEPVTITCMALDGSNVVAQTTVNVRVLVKSIEWKVAPNIIYKKGNNVESFYTTVLPNNATLQTLKYSSSDLNVATVIADQNNNHCVLVTPKYPGTFVLTCAATDGSGVQLSTTVQVVQLVEHITLNTTEKILFLEDGVTVTHQVSVKSAVPSYADILTNNSNDKFIWTSSDDTIASVNKNGLVTAIKPGTVQITATANDVGAASASCTIHVRKAVKSIIIDLYSFKYIQSSANLDVELIKKLQYLNNAAYVYSGDEVALNAELNADATVQNVIWQVAGKGTDANGANILGIYARVSDPYSNPTILTALPINSDNEKGFLNVVITCKATDGSNVTAKRVIQIRQPATSVNLNYTTLTLYTPESGTDFNSSAQLMAEILPENAYINHNPQDFTSGNLVWSSSNDFVATVDQNGCVTAVGVGEAVISAKSADNHGEVATCKVTVLQAITSLDVHTYQGDTRVEIEDGDFVYAYTNQELQLFTSIGPENASNKNLTWHSGNTLIATVDSGYLKIGNKATVTANTREYVTISCSATDGSKKSVTFNLYVLDSEYNIDVEEFLNIKSGNKESLLLKISKTDENGNQIPVISNVTVSISDGGGDTVIEVCDENGNSINSGTKLSNVSNPSFDVRAFYNGLATITFNIDPQDLSEVEMGSAVLIGKTISFEKHCTINVTGHNNRTIKISQSSLSLVVNNSQQVTAVVSPANATNYYIQYSLEPYDDNYSNPYQYAKIDTTTGIVTGFSVGMVYAVATLYDAETNLIVETNGVKQIAKVPVYITAALTGVSMENSVVYVGEDLSLLDYVKLTPAVLNQTTDKSAVVKLDVVSGSNYIQFSSENFGSIKGIKVGVAQIKAIATYGDAVYTSNIATIEVKNRLTAISLPETYAIKINQIIKLTPVITPSTGDLSNVTVTWKSSDANCAVVEKSTDSNAILTGVVTGKVAGTTTITVTVKTDKATLTASTKLTVIPIDVTDFSADTTGTKNYELTLGGSTYALHGAYNIASGNNYYSAGCLENGIMSLSTVYLNAQPSHFKSYQQIRYPDNFPLRSFLSLEQAEKVLKDQAIATGYMKNETDTAGWAEFLEVFDRAIYLSAMMSDRYDANAYIDLPNRSHLWVKSGNAYKNNSEGFKNWGHTSQADKINIFIGLSTAMEVNKDADAIVNDLKDKYTSTKVTSMKTSAAQLEGSYFTSALTSLNVLTANGDVAQRQANALSILYTYFPIDEAAGGTYDKSDVWSNDYLRVHAARQALVWAIAGVNVDESVYKRYYNINPDYTSKLTHYSGYDMYYVSLMLQAKSNDDNSSHNYMEFPYGYSAFYSICKEILAPGRFNLNYLNDIMTIIEGFVWKMDQCENRTIPSFAHKRAADATKEDNLIQLHYSNGVYKTILNDTNGVLNYYDFQMEGVTFTNNGDGTLTISVPAANVEKVKELQDKGVYTTAHPEFIPEDNKYVCAAFVKHELETEVTQIPYTKDNGDLGYVYLIGQNVQSQVINVEDLKSDLGDPFDAVMAYSFNESSEYDSQVESDVKLYNLDGQEVEYIIPNEQYQLKYIFTYTGESRNLKVVDINTAKNKSITANLYGFAADMRARSGDSTSLINLAGMPQYANQLYAVTTATSTVTTPIYELQADEVSVDIKGSYTIYNTPAGNNSQTWTSGSLWNDKLYIDANTGDAEVFSKNEIIASSNHPTHITSVSKTNGEVTITWEFYTGYITFTTPYVKTAADITIAEDTSHPVSIAQNTVYGDKYIYGLTVDGVKAVQGNASYASGTISNFSDYVSAYYFTGMVNNAIVLAQNNAKETDIDSLPYDLFDGLNYIDDGYLQYKTLEELTNAGSPQNGVAIGDVYFYFNGSDLVFLLINVGNDYCVYWTAETGQFTGDSLATVLDPDSSVVPHYTTVICRNYENHIQTENDGDADAPSSAVYDATKSASMTTAFVNTAIVDRVKANLLDFTITNAETYGGNGYLNIDLDYVNANNAQNYTTFHTDKTFMTVFDLEISNLVVNTGAGITSPTSKDNRNFVNLNVYYTINLANDAYKVITNRYGKIGGVWWHYYKHTNMNGETDASPTKYVYKKTDFFYVNNGTNVYCSANETPVANRTYYYDPTHTGSTALPDIQSANGQQIGDFIPDTRQNIVTGQTNLSVPAGWAEEKELNITLHTDVFTDFCIYDNNSISDSSTKLDPTTFAVMGQKDQMEALQRIIDNNEVTTNLFFIDNIQTGANYIQHSVPYVLTATGLGVKVYGFSAHVNKTHNELDGVVLSSGDTVYTNHALAEWGTKVGSYTTTEKTFSSKPVIGHLTNDNNLDNVYQVGSSVLGHEVAYLNKHRAFTLPQKLSNSLYKYYYYASEYNWAYENNDTATAMLQYPSYNPYTLSTMTSNGSLIYQNSSGLTGFDITLGNNETIHIPNLDAISYTAYMRKFGANGQDNAGLIQNSWVVQHYLNTDTFVNPNGSYTGVKTTTLQYESANFYKYSNSVYNLYEAGGSDATPNKTLVVENASASTKLVNSTETESLKLTKILFRSTYTTSRKLGDNGWVDVTGGSNPDALVNAGKGFELKIEVTYTNTNLTDYLARYLKDSAQVPGNTSSAASSVTSTGCNISALTGQYGTKSLKDQYTAKVLSDTVWNNVFGANLYKDVYVIMNNNNKYVYSYTGVYGSTQVFDLAVNYNYVDSSNYGEVVMTYTMKLSPVNGFFGSSITGDKTGLATQSMKFYTDSSASGTIGSLTIWTNPIAATPFGYPGNMRDRYLADIAQVNYYIVQPVDNVDNIVQ